jgi:hypothetical protein
MDSLPTLVGDVVNKFIVKPTGDDAYVGSKGFVFDVVGDEDVAFDADITDHYIESNYSIQDHIALRPPKFTLSGFIGELNDILANSTLNILTTIQSLAGVAEYTPSFAQQSAQVYGAIAGVVSQVGMVVNQATNLYQSITGALTSNSKQQAAYNYFTNLYMNRKLCTVETPWAVWKEMAIESIRIIQKDSNRFVSEFSITFKQIRIVSTKSYSPELPQWAQDFMDGRAADSNVPFSFTAGAIAGQDSLPDGSSVNTDLLSSSFSLPTLASRGSAL